jgi:large subunit ribosomal protein L15
MKLADLMPSVGARKRKKRVGCGRGSGHGKTATRGHKGQGARAGRSFYLGFEGGQMPLHRRIPKRGFVNPFKEKIEILNVESLNKFEDKATVSLEELIQANLIKNDKKKVKILGKGELKKALQVKVHLISRKAREKIEAVGGKVEILK